MGRNEVYIKGDTPDPSKPIEEVSHSLSDMEKYMQELQRRRDEAQANVDANGKNWDPKNHHRKNRKRG